MGLLDRLRRSSQPDHTDDETDLFLEWEGMMIPVHPEPGESDDAAFTRTLRELEGEPYEG